MSLRRLTARPLTFVLVFWAVSDGLAFAQDIPPTQAPHTGAATRPEDAVATGTSVEPAPEPLAPEQLAPEPLAPEPLAPERLALTAASRPPVPPSEVSTLLADAAADLGLTPERPPQVTVSLGACSFDDGPPPPAGKVNIRGSLELRGEQWWLRVSVTMADGTTHSASARLDAESYEVQVIRTLALTVNVGAESKVASDRQQLATQPTRGAASQGKATLATHGAALGGYFGFALESAGGKVDTRLVYPLVALGAGVGLATALIVAEEWSIDRPSAWYISGGGVWLTFGGVLIASEQDLTHPTDRYPYGLIGTATGLGVATFVVSQRDVSEGEAVFSQSGAIFGAIVGGFVQELADPATGKFPRLGVGVGTTGGWLAASLGTAQLMPGLTATRVLFADLGGFLGALVGAAAASPAVVNQGAPKRDDRRLFVGASLGGLALGSVVGYWLGGSVEEEDASLPVTLHATSLAPTMSPTPFDSGLPAATVFTLRSPW